MQLLGIERKLRRNTSVIRLLGSEGSDRHICNPNRFNLEYLVEFGQIVELGEKSVQHIGYLLVLRVSPRSSSGAIQSGVPERSKPH
jgi:hypothetical protein